LVYQVVSHLGSGSRIGGLRIQAWVGGGPQVSRETMQQVWGYFDSLGPTQMYAAFADAVSDYLKVESSTPDDAGLTEVDGFTAKRPRVAPGATDGAPLVVSGPDEEIVRFVSGRGFVPGAPMRLEVKRGSTQDLANLRRAFR